MRDIFLALPVYSGDITVQTASALLLAMDEARERGWQLKAENIYFRSSDADIGNARNVFLGLFLTTECTDLVFVDGDVSWGPGAFTRLLTPDVDFLAGAYRAKTDTAEIYPMLWPEPRKMQTVGGAHLLEVEGAPAGFLRLSRAGVQKMYDWAERKYVDNKHGKDVTCPWVFEFAFDGDHRLSEDYVFCRKWREVVGPCYVDPLIKMSHTGKKVYEGDLYAKITSEVAEDMAADVHRMALTHTELWKQAS